MLYQTTDTNQNVICCQYFSNYIFVTTCDILVMSLPYPSVDGLIFFCFLFVWGALGLLLWLKSKKYKDSVSFPSLMENY